MWDEARLFGKGMFFWEEICIWRWHKPEEGDISLWERAYICEWRCVLVGEVITSARKLVIQKKRSVIVGLGMSLRKEGCPSKSRCVLVEVGKYLWEGCVLVGVGVSLFEEA